MPLRRLSTSAPGSHSLGGMRKWVTFYEPGRPSSIDGRNSPDNPAMSCWADVRALHGEELLKAQQQSQVVDHLASIVYQRGVEEDQIISFEGRKLLIKYIEDADETRMFLDVYCEEVGQNAGEDPGRPSQPPALPPPPPLPPPSGLQWQTYAANANVAPAALVALKAQAPSGGMTLTLIGQEGEVLYALGTGPGVTSFVDSAGATFEGDDAYDLNQNETIVFAYTGGQWWIFD